MTAAVSLFLFFTSAYISLRLGAMPWPIIFSIVVSGGLLRLTGSEFNRHDVNVAQAGGTIGGLIAAAISFVLPGLYLTSTSISIPSPWYFAGLAGAGGMLGVLLADRARPIFIDAGDLPYPAGRAGGELIKEGFNRSRLFRFVVVAGLLTGAFALLRDHAGLYIIPVTIGGTVLPFLIAPMGVGAGYLLGLKTGVNWLAGAILGLFILFPVAHSWPGLIAESSGISPDLWVQNIGMGLVLGSGLAYLLIYGRLQSLKLLLSRATPGRGPLALSMISAAILFITGLTWWGALLVVGLVWILVPVAAQLTGSTNLDPLEQFGLLAAFSVGGVYAVMQLPMPLEAKYATAFFVAVATAVAGDIGHDFKSAQIVGTSPQLIVKADLWAVLVLIPAVPVMLGLIQGPLAANLFTAELPAPQAKIVYNSLAGLIDYRAFFGAMAAAMILEGIQYSAIRKGGGDPIILLIPLGIGIFLGWALSFTIAVGGIIYAGVRRTRPNWLQPGIVVAAGVMGGEGIVGFASAMAMSTGSQNLAPLRIIGSTVLAALAVIVILASLRGRRTSG